MGTEADVDSAATAARYALDSYGYSSREDRLALLRRILDRFDAHSEELARRITLEMGSPIQLQISHRQLEKSCLGR